MLPNPLVIWQYLCYIIIVIIIIIIISFVVLNINISIMIICLVKFVKYMLV